MNIPSAFRLLGHRIAVNKIPLAEWPHGEDCVGVWDPLNYKIDLLAEFDGSRGDHTFMHELLHAALHLMNHKLTHDEKFVDTLAGMLHQALTSCEYPKAARKRSSKK